MSTGIFLLVLCAAFLHALWNALVKGGADKGLAMAVVVLGQGVFGAAALPFAPAPDPACWPYVLGSIALHLGYQVFLLAAYRAGDLTQVYPIARGTAPLLVALVTVGFMGVEIGAFGLAGVIVIGAGLISLSLVRRQDGLRNTRAAVFAVATGCFIAAYSILDGFGARIAGSAVGFYGWIALGNAVALAGFGVLFRPALVTEVPRLWRRGLIGGGASFAAYGMVVYAFTQTPIALVTALRETSIVFALVIGVGFLKERLDLGKLASTAVTICGAALLRLGKG